MKLHRRILITAFLVTIAMYLFAAPFAVFFSGIGKGEIVREKSVRLFDGVSVEWNHVERGAMGSSGTPKIEVVDSAANSKEVLISSNKIFDFSFKDDTLEVLLREREYNERVSNFSTSSSQRRYVVTVKHYLTLEPL